MKLYKGKHCVPCKMLDAWLTEQGINIDSVLVEEHMDEVEKFNIKQTPTLLLDDGTLIAGKDEIQEYFGGEEDE